MTQLPIVDEKRGSVLHATRDALLSLPKDARFDFIAVGIFGEPLCIQAERASIRTEKLSRSRGIRSVAPDCLIFVKQIVHFPEASLQAGRFRRERRLDRVRMHRQRIMPEDHPQPAPVVLLEFTNYISNRGAGWTLEVAEFLQRDRGAPGSPRTCSGSAPSLPGDAAVTLPTAFVRCFAR